MRIKFMKNGGTFPLEDGPVSGGKIRCGKVFAWFISACFLLFLFGCATGNLDRRIHRSQAEWMRKQMPVAGDLPTTPGPHTQGGLQIVMNRLINVSPLAGFFIPIAVVSDKDVLAQTDGKKVYVGIELLKALEHREDVLAAVIAHELGHIIAHHKPRGVSEAVWRMASPLSALNQIASWTVLGLREISRMGEKAYSRYEEKEADTIAVVLTHRAGYNPYALAEFMGIGLLGKDKNWKAGGVPIANYANPVSAAQSAALFVLHSSPFYRTHPPGKKRQESIKLIADRVTGKISWYELEQADKELGVIHRALIQN